MSIHVDIEKAFKLGCERGHELKASGQPFQPRGEETISGNPSVQNAYDEGKFIGQVSKCDGPN